MNSKWIALRPFAAAIAFLSSAILGFIGFQRAVSCDDDNYALVNRYCDPNGTDPVMVAALVLFIAFVVLSFVQVFGKKKG